jgi:hypothetical protein
MMDKMQQRFLDYPVLKKKDFNEGSSKSGKPKNPSA